MAGTTQLGPHARKPELRALTGLRAVAAIAVVVSHVGVPKSVPEHIAKIAHWGYIGVPLFFMLSGVVLAYNYPELRPRHGRRTIKFYVARVARVMPLYWVMIAYCVCLYWSVNHEQYPWALVQNVLAIQTWSPDTLVAQSYYNGPGWSIGAELFFYALFPFLVPVMARIAKRWGPRGLVVVIAAVAVLSAALVAWFTVKGWSTLPATNPASGHRWLYRNPLCQLPIFICGMSVAFLLPHAREWSRGTHHVIQTVVPLYVLILAAFRDQGSFWGAASYGAFFVIPFAVVLLSLGSGQGWLARLLATRPMVALGVASFALYLTHRWLVWQLNTFDPVAKGHGLDPYVGFVATIAVLLLIGEGAHRYVEEPARRWVIKISQRLARRFPSRRQPPAPHTPADLELPAPRKPATAVGR
jgi:peptidoglycan/LPS O-acetylase OafA/YrhL